MWEYARFDSVFSMCRQRIGGLALPFAHSIRAARPRVNALQDLIPTVFRPDGSKQCSATSNNGAGSGNGAERAGDNAGENILRIKGEVKNNIELPSCELYVEESGRVEGKLLVKRVTISGTVSGDIEAGELVAVKATGQVHGSVVAPRIALEETGTINGTLVVG